ncbi:MULTISPECIES: O-methyltransferase [Clostridium]|jgi:predicted O-methyltransferase YrrM|uniref:tRNA 5-hydroxyuridine methyltransferase n=2 Tax=Clostridium TaxID=1485 RepID=A0A151AQW4_9CLOT|nr:MULTISPECIES: O-methyltransferase [Clostridium]KYH29970.1 putative O-methyltransferase [Clostridium colicanis DSM 13634]MBE6044177.1 O-methyltransferase [Clostridium thermopalmarium]PRR75933.1 putative O-methyltransferase [Clostridium thermopalmarium DSM 5974]PVZ24510.1 putative O-methyltransferase YrrM [Clostridium thermopalmarium DSM 5974]
MSGVTHDYMTNYIRTLIKEEVGILKELEDFAEKEHIPIVQKEVGNFLKFMVSFQKPQKILELGTAIGYSAILMSIASNNKSKITTIERDKKMIDIAKSNIIKYNFQDKINILEGDCLEVLSNLDDKYDMIFMDAGKGHYSEFFPHCMRLLNPKGIIIADNVLFRGMVANDELVERRKITIVKRMRSYLDMISKDKNLITSVIPMGDGIAITTRRETDA